MDRGPRDPGGEAPGGARLYAVNWAPGLADQAIERHRAYPRIDRDVADNALPDEGNLDVAERDADHLKLARKVA